MRVSRNSSGDTTTRRLMGSTSIASIQSLDRDLPGSTVVLSPAAEPVVVVVVVV